MLNVQTFFYFHVASPSFPVHASSDKKKPAQACLPVSIKPELGNRVLFLWL
jgi:hypothetical protein